MRKTIVSKLLFVIFCVISFYTHADYLYNDITKSDKYITFDVFLNDDLEVDKVVTSKPYEGDELYLFIRKGDKYRLSYKGHNLSEDGGTILDSITQTNLERKNHSFSIILKSYNENYKENHHIEYRQGDWYIESTDYIIDNNLDDYTKTFNCHVKQNIKLSLYNQVHPAPESNDYNKNCTIDYYIEPSLDKFLVRFDSNNPSVYLGVDRYKYLFKKFPLNKDNMIQYNEISAALEKNKAYNESIFILRNIIRLYPSRTVAYINLGDALWEKKDIDKAKDAYRTYIKLMKKDGRGSKIPKQVLKRVSL